MGRSLGEERWAGEVGRGGVPAPEDGALAGLVDHVVVFVERQQLGEAEVGDLDVRLALHQDVTRGKVAVHIAAGAQVLHALQASVRATLQRNQQGPNLAYLESNPNLSQNPSLTLPQTHPALQSRPQL